jgi:7-cyano-7-deazaguanine synthase
MKKTVILFSSGLDSTTVLYYARNKGYDCHCLIFDYGQKHKKEVENAISILQEISVPFYKVELALPWSNDALTNSEKSLPLRKTVEADIPATYVPGRNTIFLSYGLSYAQSINAQTIFIGANALDYSGYPDCRPEFIEAYNNVLKSLGLDIKVLAPLMKLTKAQIIKMGTELNVPYGRTWSCYSGGDKPCGKCDSCLLRAKGFEEAGLKDPAL